jgi:hypothetical protein
LGCLDFGGDVTGAPGAHDSAGPLEDAAAAEATRIEQGFGLEDTAPCAQRDEIADVGALGPHGSGLVDELTDAVLLEPRRLCRGPLWRPHARELVERDLAYDTQLADGVQGGHGPRATGRS